MELKNDPGQAQAKAYLGDVYRRRRELENATRLRSDILKSDPHVRIAHLDLGITYIYQKQYGRAVAALQDAVRLDPTQVDAHYRLARTYHAMGRDQDANDEFRQVTQLEKRSETSCFGRFPVHRRLLKSSNAQPEKMELTT
jgi:Flp pilus assembly protein TadD